ncbi:MAG: alkaline phosphatase family protein [Ktedonobacteraceae bacterium]
MKHSRRSIHFVARIGISGIAILALMALLSPSVFAEHANGNSGDESSIARFQHVFVIMMENTSYTSLIGNPNAPWINHAANVYGLATDYTGVTHPSQPNYIASTSGSLNGVSSDSPITVNVPNIVDQLEAPGKSWKAYMQSLSLCNGNLLASSCGNQLYERKHDPFASYLDVQSNPERMENIVGLGHLYEDLANHRVPDYSWISPDQCHDMHGRSGPSTDPCNFNDVQGLISAGDDFLSHTVDQIMDSPAWKGNSVIFITWDESDYPFGDTSGCCDAPAGAGGGHVVTLVISRSKDEHVMSGEAFNHYSMLATIEASWKLGCLGFTCDRQNVKPLRDLVEENN